MLREQLLELDFTSNQAETYLALLELGQTKVGPVISKTGFHRNIVYRALEDLIARKLVYKITKRGVAHFEATDPSPLLEELRSKQRVAHEVIEEVKKKHGVSASEVFVYSGEQGVKDVNNQIEDDLYLIGANGTIMERYPEYFKKFEERRIKKGLKKYMLTDPKMRGTAFVSTPLTEVKYLPSSTSSPMVIWISGNLVAHLLWEKPETIFVIKNKKIADNYRDYFQLLWKQDSWVLKGKQGFLDLLNTISEEQQDLRYLNAMGGGLKAFPIEYRTWLKEFANQGHKSFWLMSPKFSADDSDTGGYHSKRKLKIAITSPTVNWIFGSYVANVLWEGDNAPTIFLIKNQAIAQSYHEHFGYLWKHGSVPLKLKTAV